MITEYLNYYFTGHIYTSIFLIPIILFYFFLLLKKMSYKTTLLTHKILLLSLFGLPLLIIIYSHLNINLPKPSKTQLPQAFPSKTYDTIANIARTPITVDAQDYHITGDVIFYFSNFLILFSLIGLIIFLFKYINQSIYLSKIKLNATKSYKSENIDIYYSDKINSPFAIGVFQKSIFLPNFIGEKDREIILKHEINHIRYHHSKWSFLENILSYFFWYNPLIYILKSQGPLLREFECDEKTLLEVDRFEYSKSLLSAAESLNQNTTLNFLAHSWLDKSTLKKRIEFIVGERKSEKRKVLTVFLGLVTLISFGIFYIQGNINDELLESFILKDIHTRYQKSISLNETVEIEKVPPHFIKALLIHEDLNFFDHKGASLLSIFTATGRNIYSKLFTSNNRIYGGSTITQQLAKSFLTHERTLDRKFKELKISRILEKNFSKNVILEMYLNRVYLGQNTWGLAAASLKYFQHKYTKLSLEESAMIIPFLAAPTKYNLIDNPQEAKSRQMNFLKRLTSN